MDHHGFNKGPIRLLQRERKPVDLQSTETGKEGHSADHRSIPDPINGIWREAGENATTPRHENDSAISHSADGVTGNFNDRLPHSDKTNSSTPVMDKFWLGDEQQESNFQTFDDDEDLPLFSSSGNRKEEPNSTANSSANGQCNGRNRSDKTPMCLVAEMARYNSVPHQYKLINEEGPAHHKLFTVTLLIGEGEKKEEYTAQGASIKKAQQAAAQQALDGTNLPKRAQRFFYKGRHTARMYGYCAPDNAAVTPTTTLNALAIKLGVKPDFTFLNSPYPGFSGFPPVPPLNPIGLPARAFHGAAVFTRSPQFPPFFRYPPPIPAYWPFSPVPLHYVSLRIGDREFFGQGHNRQLAKHDASVKAVKALESLIQQGNQIRMNGRESDEAQLATSSNAGASNEDPAPTLEQELEVGSKSAINLVHEFTLRRRMDVSFEVVSENGPAHQRHFIIRCLVHGASIPGLITEGDGASKKQAKHDASEKMLHKLKEVSDRLPSPTVPRLRQGQQCQQQPVKEKKRKHAIIKDLKSDPNYGLEVNPVSRLIQVQQAKNEPEPVFEFVREEGHARCKEFIVKAVIGETTCEGKGPNKKLAKRAAAEAMLEIMGYAKPLPKPGKPLLKHRLSPPTLDDDSSNVQYELEASSDIRIQSSSDPSSTQAEKHRKVKFQLGDAEIDCDGTSDDVHDGASYRRHRHRYAGRRLAPGLFMLPFRFDDCDHSDQKSVPNSSQEVEEGTASSMNEGAFGPSNDSAASAASSTPSCAADNAKDHLEYLSDLLSFRIQFTDFPKTLRDGENGEYLSLVSIGTNPPVVSHGSGSTVQEAQNEAAFAALRSLAGKGLNTGHDPLPPREHPEGAMVAYSGSAE